MQTSQNNQQQQQQQQQQQHQQDGYRYSPGPHFVDELQGQGMELEPSDSQSPNMNLNYSASPMPPSDSRDPNRNRQQIKEQEEQNNRQIPPGGGTFYANSPSLLSGQQFVHSSTYVPIQTSPGMELSQGTAGFGGVTGGAATGGVGAINSSIQSLGGGGAMSSYEAQPSRQISSSIGGRDTRSPGYHHQHQQHHHQPPPLPAGFSQSSMGSSTGKLQHQILPHQLNKLSPGSSLGMMQQQPQRTGSAPIPGGGRISSPVAGGSDSLAHYSLVSGSGQQVPIQQHQLKQQAYHFPQQNRQLQQPQSLSLEKQLAEKVRSQAQRLQKLEQYKTICEKRIVEIAPQHPIPVLSQHLGMMMMNHQQANRDQAVQKQIQFQQMKQQISLLQSQKMQFKKLFEQRDRDLQQLQQDNDKNLKSNSNFFQGTLGVNNQQRINQLMREKKQIYENLQAETLRCQELRIHNEILKESLESNIERLGIGDLLRQSSINNKKLSGSGKNSRKLNQNEIDLFLELTKLKAQNDTYRSEKMKAQARNAEMQHQLNRVQENHGKSQHELNSLSHQFSQCKQANLKLESEKNALLEYIEQKVQLHEKLANEVDFVKNQNNQLLNEKNDLEKLTKDLEQEFNEQQDKVKRLDGQKKSFQRQNQSLKGQVSMLNQQLRKSDEKLEQCEKQLTSLKQQMQEQNKQLGTARSQLQNHRSQLQKVVKTTSNDKELLQKRLKSQQEKLSIQLRHQKQQDELTSHQIQNLKNRLQSTQQKYSKAKQNLHKAEKECFEKKDQLQRIASQRHMIQNQKQRLQSTLSKVKTQLNTNRIRMQELNLVEQKYESAIQQLKELQREKLNISEKYSKVQDQFNNTNSQLQLLRSDLQKSERYMMETEREKKNQIHQIKQALVQKHKNHNDILSDLNKMRRELSVKDEQISALNGEIRMYKQELQDLYGADKRAHRLAQDFQIKSKQAKGYQKNMTELNEKLNTVRGQLDGTQFESSRLKRQNQNLKERMKALEMDIEEMVRDRTRMMDQNIQQQQQQGRKKKKRVQIYGDQQEQIHRRNRQTSPIVVVQQNGQQIGGRSSNAKRSSPLRNAPPSMFIHQRQSSQTYRHSGDILAGVNACLESIRQFIRKVKSSILSAPQISIKFKDLVENMGANLNRRIIDHSEVEQAIYRIDEWLQESMHEFQRMVSLFPTKDDHRRHLTERSTNMQNFSHQKQTRILAFDTINERDDDFRYKKQQPNTSRHNQRINHHLRRLTRKSSLPGPSDMKNQQQQQRSQNNSALLPPNQSSSDGINTKLNELRKEKDQLQRWTMRIIDSIPTPQLRNICRSIIENHQNIINITADRARIQQKLTNTESLYKMQIRKQKAGTTSEEGSQLRKQVEMVREQFQNCKQHQEIAEKKMENLQEELKHLEDIQKRRANLGLENQKTVAKLKMDLQDMRAEIIRLQRANQDAMMLRQKMTDERKYLDQELISLRSQIVGMNMNQGGGGIGGNVNNSARHYQGQHGQVPSFGGGGVASSNQINKSSSSQKFGGEFGDFMPRRFKNQGGQTSNRSFLSRQNQSDSRSRSPAAQKMKKALDQSKRTMAQYSPGGAKQIYQRLQRRQADQANNRNFYHFPTLGADANSEQHSNMSPMQTRMRSQEQQLDSESSPPKNSLKERLDNVRKYDQQNEFHQNQMKQAIQERLMDSQQRGENSME